MKYNAKQELLRIHQLVYNTRSFTLRIVRPNSDVSVQFITTQFARTVLSAVCPWYVVES